jgi:uncharacterized protein with NRDE domain
MCLILFAYKKHPHYPLVFAANRDEFYERPSETASFWDDKPDILAGRDLKDGGTWLGITKKGRIAALTNYRDPASIKKGAPSRGWLVRNFLFGEEKPLPYFRKIASSASEYNGFSLICGDISGLYYYSNRGSEKPLKLSPGLHGLSNNLLNTPWPKIERGKEVLSSYLLQTEYPDPEDIFRILMDQSKPPDESLPDTGVGLLWERVLSSIFIKSPEYGTRSSTVIMIDKTNHVTFIEKVFNSHSTPWVSTKIEFRIP